MGPESPVPGEAPSGGLVQSLRDLAASAVGVLHTRLELLATEIEEERLRILQLLVWACAAVLFFSFGLLMFTLAAVVLFWDTHRLAVIVVLGVAYLAAGGTFAIMARRKMQRARFFSASLAELAKDRDRLTSQ